MGVSSAATPTRFVGLTLTAFVIFDSTTGTIKRAQGVSSVVHVATGQWTVNFSSARASTNYLLDIWSDFKQTGQQGRFYLDPARTVNAFTLSCLAGVSVYVDDADLYIGVYE